MYLGENEILECYIGNTAITEAYLGEELVFSSGPFVGLKMPKNINFTPTKLENTIKVKASESWSFTTIPTGFTVSPTTGDSGITLVTVSTSASSANTTGTLVATSTNYIASATCNYTYGTPMLTINGSANIVTGFYPAVAYDNNGGYPGKYDARARQLIDELKPDIFVCGHSHILKVVRDQKRDMLVINPGAAGIQGFHLVRTALRFHIENGRIDRMEVFELDRESFVK